MSKVSMIAVLFTFMLATALPAQELLQKTVRQPQKGSIITGSFLVGTPVALSLFASLMSGYGFESIIPIAGPLILMGNDPTSSEGGAVVYIGLSLAEAIGTGLIIGGAVGKKRVVSVNPYFYRNGAGCTVAVSLPRRD